MELSEQRAQEILSAAIRESRAAELLMTLFNGGSATLDRTTRSLVLVDGDMLKSLR